MPIYHLEVAPITIIFTWFKKEGKPLNFLQQPQQTTVIG